MARFTARERRASPSEIIARYPRPKSALIPLLHLAQEQDGYVADDAMEHIAELVGVTAGRGARHLLASTRCSSASRSASTSSTSARTSPAMLLGGEELLAPRRGRRSASRPGSTTADGMFTIEDVECIAACTEAPCLQVNYRYFHQVTTDDARRADRRPAGRPAERRDPAARHARPHPPAASPPTDAPATPSPARPRSRSGSAPPRARRRTRRVTVTDAPPIVTHPLRPRRRPHPRRATCATGGYEGLQAALRQAARPRSVDEVKAASLLGRGGAGFPAGTKWGFCPPGVWPRYLVVNGDESEPGTYKDRILMERDPHQLIEGVLIACYADRRRPGVPLRPRRDGPGPGAHRRRPSTRPTPPATSARTSSAPTSPSTSSCTGAPAPTSSARRPRSSSRLEGNRGMPRLKPPFFPAAKGLYLQPTIVNNVETLSNLPWIITNGGAEFAELGAETAPGTRLFAVSGHVKQPGRVRGRVRRHHVPRPHLRRPLYGGGIRGGNALKAFIPGGASAPWFFEEHLDLPARAGRRRRGRLDARLRRHRRDGRRPPTR